MNKLGTKAETLRMLYRKLKNAEVLPQYIFTVEEWREHPEEIQQRFLELEWNSQVIVRSSSLAEDTSCQSQAGKYESIANVSGENEFREAVKTVIESYDDANGANQILVQPMLSDVSICGVAFTLDPNTMGNYYVINYDENGSTSAITSGQGRENKLYYRFKWAHLEEENQTEPMNRLCRALKELEEFFGQDNLDVEFAFTADGTLYILQVRALCTKSEPADMEAMLAT